MLTSLENVEGNFRLSVDKKTLKPFLFRRSYPS